MHPEKRMKMLALVNELENLMKEEGLESITTDDDGNIVEEHAVVDFANLKNDAVPPNKYTDAIKNWLERG